MTPNPTFRRRSALRLLLVMLAGCGVLAVVRAAPDVAIPGIRLVPEMERVEEVDRWPAAPPGHYGDDRQPMLAAWTGVCGLVQQQVTADGVIKLSKWAKPQMQSYVKVPALDHPDFQPHSASAAADKVVFAATMEVLPTHSPLVTRWLKVFVVYDRGHRAILQVVVTIRGEAQE